LTTAFIHERLQATWKDAMQELVVTLNASSLGKLIMLKFCLLLTEEIATQGPRMRTESELQRNAHMRDSMRAEGDNAILCHFWKEIMAVTADSEESVEAVAEALNCLAAYSHWIDVNLVVEAESLRMLYQCLQSRTSKIQLAAASCLGKIVLKGMPVRDKIALFKYLNLESVFMAVINRGVVDSFCAVSAEVLNNLALSLSHVLNCSSNNAEASADRAILLDFYCENVLMNLLSFMRLASMNQTDESLLLLVNTCPLLSVILIEARAQKEEMRREFSSFLQSLLPLILHLLPRFLQEINVEEMSLEFPVSVSDSLDEDEGKVLTTLLQAFDAIAWIMTHVTIASLRDLLNDGIEHVPFERMDLLAILLLRLPEAIKGCPVFVLKIDGNAQKTSTAELLSSVLTLPMHRSGLQARQWLFIARLIARYSSTSFFDVFPEEIEPSLQVLYRWLELGSWSSEEAGELLLRVCRNLKGKLGLHSMGLLGALQPAMASGRVRSTSVYEICGLAVATLDSSVVSLASASESLLSSVLQRMSASGMIAEHVRCLEFVGAFARGFVSDTCSDPLPVQSYFVSQVLPALRSSLLRKDSSIAGAVISATQRLIPLCQTDMIPLIREIVLSSSGSDSPLLGDANVLQGLLPLIAASLFKLRDSFANAHVLGVLWPMIEDNCLRALGRAPQGTDDWVQMGGMLRALMALLLAFVNSTTAAEVTVNPHPRGLESLMVSTSQFMSLPGASSALPECAALYRTFISLSGKVLSRLPATCLVNRILPSIYQVFLPAAITEAYPLPTAQMRQSDEAVRKHLASLPATQHQLVHEAVTLLRVVAGSQPALLSSTGLPSVFLDSNRERLLNRATDAKDLKTALFMLYLLQ